MGLRLDEETGFTIKDDILPGPHLCRDHGLDDCHGFEHGIWHPLVAGWKQKQVGPSILFNQVFSRLPAQKMYTVSNAHLLRKQLQRIQLRSISGNMPFPIQIL